MITTTEEADDLEERVNEVELQLISAKEFSHLSSETLELLQQQIDELRSMLEKLLVPPAISEPKPDPYLMFF